MRTYAKLFSPLVRPCRYTERKMWLLLAMLRGLCVCVCVSHTDTTISLEKTAEPIDVPFSLWTRVCFENHVLAGCPEPHGKVPYSGGHTWPYPDFPAY